MSNPLTPKHRKGLKYDDSSGGLPEWIQSDDAAKHDALRKANVVAADSGKVGKKQIEKHKKHKGFDALITHKKHHYIDCDADSYESSTKKVHVIGDIEESASLTYGNHIYDDGNPGSTLLANPCDELALHVNAETCKNGLGTMSEAKPRYQSDDKGDSMLPDTDDLAEGDAVLAPPLDALTPAANNAGVLENGTGKFAVPHTQTTDKNDGNKEISTFSHQISPLSSSTQQQRLPETITDITVEQPSSSKSGRRSPNTLHLAERVIKAFRVRNVNGDLMFRNPSNGVYRPASKEEISGYILMASLSEANGYGKPDMLKHTAEFMRAINALTPEDIISDKNVIVFLDCIYEYLTDSFRPLNELGDRYVTACIQANVCEKGNSCKTADSFLRYAFWGNEQLINRFWEMLGLCISNDMNAKVLGVLYGPSNTGKSAALQMFQMFFESGITETTLAIQKFGDRFALSSIIGKHLVSFGDLPENVSCEAALSVIKAIVGKDKIQTEAKYQDLHNYRPECKLLFATNHKLLTATKDEAFEKRVIVMPFLRPVPKEKMDRELADKFRAEAGAIAQKALNAYIRLRENNYEFTPLPPEFDVDIFEYREYMAQNSDKVNQALVDVQGFFDTCCEYDVNAFISTEELYRAYCTFCDSNVLVRRDKKYFSTLLNQICGDKVEKHKRGSNNGFLGITLKED